MARALTGNPVDRAKYTCENGGWNINDQRLLRLEDIARSGGIDITDSDCDAIGDLLRERMRLAIQIEAYEEGEFGIVTAMHAPNSSMPSVKDNLESDTKVYSGTT